jgi:hypothetical protein
MNRYFWINLPLAILLLIGQAGFASAAGNASLILSGVSRPAEVGKTFVVNLNINPGGASVDTARAHITFSNNLISAVNVSLIGNLDSPSPGNSINNGSGSISWGGFTVDRPQLNSGVFARITFRANAVGDAQIGVASASKLISDGEEVGNPGSFNQITVKVVPAGEGSSPIQLSSSTHPDSDKWYQASTLQMAWNNIPGAEFLWAFDREPETIPSQSIKETGKTIRNVKSGIWYFHLVAKLSDGKLTEPVHYRVQVDTVKPNPIEPYLDVNENEQLAVRFGTTDYHSGIASYDMSVNQQNIENVANPYILRGLNIGENLISVTAYDFAGNVRQGWVRFILNSDGTIRDITTSQSACSLPFGCDAKGYLFLGGIPLLIIGFYLLYRRRTPVAPVGAIPGIPPTGGETIITSKTPDGVFTRTSIHTHTHSYTDTDTYTDTAPNAPVPPAAGHEGSSSSGHQTIEKNHKKGSSKNRKKR